MIVKQNLLKKLPENITLEQMESLYNNYGIQIKIKNNNEVYAIMAEIFQEVKTRRI